MDLFAFYRVILWDSIGIECSTPLVSWWLHIGDYKGLYYPPWGVSQSMMGNPFFRSQYRETRQGSWTLLLWAFPTCRRLFRQWNLGFKVQSCIYNIDCASSLKAWLVGLPMPAHLGGEDTISFRWLRDWPVKSNLCCPALPWICRESFKATQNLAVNP